MSTTKVGGVGLVALREALEHSTLERVVSPTTSKGREIGSPPTPRTSSPREIVLPTRGEIAKKGVDFHVAVIVNRLNIRNPEDVTLLAHALTTLGRARGDLSAVQEGLNKFLAAKTNQILASAKGNPHIVSNAARDAWLAGESLARVLPNTSRAPAKSLSTGQAWA